MAKRKVKQEVPLTRKQVSRRERERRQRFITIGVAASVGLLIVGILGYGLYAEQVVKPASPVAVVNGVPISTATYQKRLLFTRANIDGNIENLQFQKSTLDPDQDQFLISFIDQQISQLMISRTGLSGESFVEQLIQAKLIAQAAEENGIIVSSEEIDREIEESFDYYVDPPTPTPSPTMEPITATPEVTPTVPLTPTPEMTPSATPTPMTRTRFEELYGEFLSNLQEATGMTEAEYREIVLAGLLREKMEELVSEQVPTAALQVHVRHILVDSRDEAEAVLERLGAGEDFAALAQELSQDPSNADEGGDLGWFPQGQMVPEFDEVAFSLRPGDTSDVVETSFGYHIIRVDEREANRELDPAALEQRRLDSFQAWLLEQEASTSIERYWSADKVPPE